MAIDQILAAMGAVPAGAQPKTIITDQNGEQTAGYYDTSSMGNLLRTLKTQQLKVEADQKKKMEALQKQADMYKTLREAGYDPKAAYEAVNNHKLTAGGSDDFLNKDPKEKILAKMSRGETLTAGEQKIYDDTIKRKVVDPTARTEILRKIADGEDLTEGEQQIYDETIKKKTSDNPLGEALGDAKPETPNQKKMRDKILEKIGTGAALTPGEQKIYDEVIKKGSGTKAGINSASALEEALAGGPVPSNRVPSNKVPSNKVPDEEEKVKVITPDGKRGWIPKKNLQRALKAGYRKA